MSNAVDITSMCHNPKRIFCISGKRKTGKDYIANLLYQRLPGSVVIRLSAPIKQHWAEAMHLNLPQLMSDNAYKESHRAQMIVWGEQERMKDPGVFCRSAIHMANGDQFPIWIVADMRRGTDLNFFQERYPGNVTTVRIVASDHVRKERGFIFTPGIDDAESECGLDHISDWDLIIQNDCDGESPLEEALRSLINGC